MNYRIEEKSDMLLIGFKRRFVGTPDDQKEQDHNFATETRLEQYFLEGICREHETVYEIYTNFDADGYDFYYAYLFPKWALENFDDLPEDIKAKFEKVEIPAGTYFVCETERCMFPTALKEDLRRRAVSEWLPSSGYELRNAPEIGVIHWPFEDGNDEVNNSHYCELWLPIQKK